jgi:hypothetical protein
MLTWFCTNVACVSLLRLPTRKSNASSLSLTLSVKRTSHLDAHHRTLLAVCLRLPVRCLHCSTGWAEDIAPFRVQPGTAGPALEACKRHARPAACLVLRDWSAGRHREDCLEDVQAPGLPALPTTSTLPELSCYPLPDSAKPILPVSPAGRT